MSVENGQWIMYGVSEDDPYCIHTPEELTDLVNELGFLPLFRNEIPGLSVEERTVAHHWWSEVPEIDPWEWRAVLARSGEVVYGKFFNQKAGFVSKKWFPDFANFRRDGYDFEARWEDEKASMRQKKLMNQFPEYDDTKFSHILKAEAGFGKGGEKNFEGTLASLQMLTYLCTRDFRQRLNKKGIPYGWALAVIGTPEGIVGEAAMEEVYKSSPEESRRRIIEHMKDVYPFASPAALKTVIGV